MTTLKLSNEALNCEPLWAINNPYLEILSPRFFSNHDSADWSDLPKRVGRLFLKAEKKYSTLDVAEEKTLELVKLIHEGAFLPNSPVMMNSESDDSTNLFACHVLSPPSSFSDLDVAKQIHDGCGGIGYDFPFGLSVEARYKQGIIDYDDGFSEFGDSSDPYYDDNYDKNNLNGVFQIGVSYKFDFSK